MKKPYGNIAIALSILFIPLIVYILKFSSLGFSKNPLDWTNFSTYFNISIGLCNLFIFYWLTKEIHIYNIKKDQENIKPIISFFKREGSKLYTIENIGLRAAIDLRIWKNIKENNWLYEKEFYTLPPGEKIESEWTSDGVELLAKYKDINGQNHFSYIEGNMLTFFDEKSGKEKFSNIYEKANYPMIKKWTIDNGGEDV
jgi:hypothetical protein